MISIIQIVQAVPELTFDDAYDFSELVIVGQIESVEILSEPFIGENISKSGIALYDVTILFSLKNPDNITEITVPGKFLREPHGMAYETYPFEVSQVVVLFIQPDDYISGYDFVIRSGNSEVIYPVSQQDNQCENHLYSYYNGYCMRTEIQNQDLPMCDPNPEHDFGKCKPEPEPEQDTPIPENCGPETILQDGICVITSENDSTDTSVKWESSSLQPQFGLDCEVLHIWNYAIDDCHFRINSINFLFSLILPISIVFVVLVLIVVKYKRRF